MKKIIPFFAIMILLASLVTAAPMPHLIYGQVTSAGDPLSNLKLEIENLDTSMKIEINTNYHGKYQIDLGNEDDRYRDGDRIKVTLVYCRNVASCSKTVSVSGGGNEISWDIDAEGIVTLLPDTITIVKYICWDGTGVSNQADCPPAPIITTYVCADGTEVNDASECPESSPAWVTWIIRILLGIFAGAGTWRIGKELYHYHRGLRSYHNAHTQHRNLKYRHARFWSNPIQCIKDVKKIQQGIDLSK